MFTAAVIISTLMFSLWLVSLYLRDASIVDIAWGSGFVLVAWAVFLNTNDRPPMAWLLPTLTTIWGLRLSAWLGWRNHGQPEDYRYQAMRRHWGKSFPLVSLLTVFALQGVIMWIVSLPLQMAIGQPDRWLPLLAVLGSLVWGGGLFFESIGDWQLSRFRGDPTNQGQVLDYGLWRYTRHPNYFGDFLVWWGLFLVAMSQSTAWWTVIGPALMSFFLMKVSGVPLLEKSLRKTKPEYASYVRKTNAFFPGRPAS